MTPEDSDLLHTMMIVDIGRTLDLVNTPKTLIPIANLRLIGHLDLIEPETVTPRLDDAPGDPVKLQSEVEGFMRIDDDVLLLDAQEE